MGKRSNFARNSRDYYRTRDPRVVAPLLAITGGPVAYYEPCAGDGSLVKLLRGFGFACEWASDIEPQDPGIDKLDAMTLTRSHLFGANWIVTNPPWYRPDLHAMIRHFITLAPTTLLFDADWAHTKQSAELMQHCRAISAIGRVRWIEGSRHDGKDNCAWYHFTEATDSETVFYGRQLEAAE